MGLACGHYAGLGWQEWGQEAAGLYSFSTEGWGRLLLLFSPFSSPRAEHLGGCCYQPQAGARGSGPDTQENGELSSSAGAQEEVGQPPVGDVPMLLLRLSPGGAWLQGLAPLAWRSDQHCIAGWIEINDFKKIKENLIFIFFF